MKAIKAPNRYLKAFTLVESVAVFLVVAAFCLLPVLGVKSWQEELKIKRFLNRFEKMVLVCQQIAIVEEQVTSIKNIRIPERVFVFSTGSTSAERPRPFDDDIFETLFIPEALKGGNSISEIKFLAREGHPSKLVKVKFIWEKRNITYRYQFQLGGGRFENPWNKASILLESLIALAMLTLCIVFYQGATVNLLKQEQRQYEKLRGTRVLYEEVREYRIHGGELSRRLSYGSEVYHVEFTENLRQAKVTSTDDEVVIDWVSQSFHFD